MANINGNEIYFGIIGEVGSGGGGWSDWLVNLVPAMTNYTTPRGEVVYSGNYGTGADETRLAWTAFDGIDSQTNSSSAWSDDRNPIDGSPNSVYCGYVFPTGIEVKVDNVEVASFSDRNYDAVIQIYDGTNWTTAASNISIPSGGYNKQSVSLGGAICKGVRLCFVGGEAYMAQPRYGCAICEINVYGYTKCGAT